jgi:hypothetical protein
MTWLEKMDAVLLCLDKLSGNNPGFSDLEKWLAEKYPTQIDKGEIQDITLFLWREGMMYFETGGDRTAHYNDRDPNGRYLISTKGKLLRENPGGFVQQKINDDAENSRVEKLETSQQKLMERLNFLTGWVAGGTIALVLVELWKMALDYHWFSCH